MDLAWWQRGAIYQIYPRSFADSNGDGIGDLAGIQGRLEHLVALGVEALWLSPFYPSPMADFGYDVSDYEDVDPLFGTLAGFDALVEAAHANGLRVIVDWVANHSSDRHPWFSDPARRHWYVWRDQPNNWRTAFRNSGPAWTRDASSGQWYLHSFLPEQPDLNWDEPEVEAAMHDVLRFWLRRGADGFRMDAVFKIAKDPQLRDNEPDRRHDQDWPTMVGRLQRIRRVLEEFEGDRVGIGEVYLPTQADLARYVNSGDQLHLVHNFHFLQQPWAAGAFRQTVEEFLGLLEPGAWAAWCLGNHDHSRIATRYGPRAVRVAAMLLVTLRGTPFLFQGEELGLADVPVPPEQAIDFDGRDPERGPIPWEPPSRAGAGAGFTSGRPWLPVDPAAEQVNAATQRDDPHSVLNLYRALLALRRAEPDLQGGELSFLDSGDDDVLAYMRGERHVIALNFAPAPRRATLPGPATLALGTRPGRAPGEPVGGELELEADEGVVLRR
jgi:alpha-glucosidase